MKRLWFSKWCLWICRYVWMIFLRLGGVQQPAGVEALKREDVGALPLVSVRGSTNEASEAANETTGFFENTRSRGASEPLRLTGEPNSGTSVGSATLMRQVNVTVLPFISFFSLLSLSVCSVRGEQFKRKRPQQHKRKNSCCSCYPDNSN